MIKSIIIIGLLAVIGYSYTTDTSVKSIIIKNNVKFQSPIAMRKS